jgi:hypothetical protein
MAVRDCEKVVRLVTPSYPDECKRFADWLARQHGEEEWVATGPFYGYGLMDGDEICAAVILEPFHSEGSILASMSISTPDILRHRSLVKECLSIPFSEMFDANRVSLIIEETYTRVIRVAEFLGFEVEGVLPCQFGSNSGILMGMTKDPLGLAG